jgi:hypothetical protein
VGFPSPPWALRGQAWLSLFRATAPGDVEPASWCVGWVTYGPGSALEYSELLVARAVRARGSRSLTVRHMWVDSATSREAGRSLWAMPKELASFEREDGEVGRVARTRWSATVDGVPLAHAEFADASGLVPLRVPVRAGTWQVHEDARPVAARLAGTTRALPCLATWEVAADGPLGWLHGRAPLISGRLRDFAMTLG